MPSPLDTNRRVMLLAGRRLEFLRSTSIFFIATRPVWFTCQPSIVVNQFKVPTDLSIQKQGFMDGFLGPCRLGPESQYNDRITSIACRTMRVLPIQCMGIGPSRFAAGVE